MALGNPVILGLLRMNSIEKYSKTSIKPVALNRWCFQITGRKKGGEQKGGDYSFLQS